MPRFAFEARDAQGRSVRGFETALDVFELDRRLSQSDLLLVDAEPARARRVRRSSDRALIDCCYHLSIALDAGIPVLQALTDLRDQDGGPLAEALGDVARKLEGGATLSEALAERPIEFPPLMRSLVRAGEATGSLERILADLVKYLEWREDLRRQIRSAATYPVIVVVGVAALCAIVTTYVLPNFLNLFLELGVELPASTRALIALSGFVEAYGLRLLGLAAAVAVGVAIWGRTEGGRLALHRLVLRVPLLGRLIAMIEASRFSHNLGVLYGAGLPIVAGLELVRDVAQNEALRRVLDDVRDRVGRGETLADALGRHALMPGIVLRMVSIGESSGRLDQSLERAASFYDREVPELIARSLALFNTGAIVFLGAAVVTIGLSLFVPLYSMMGNLNAAPG